MGHVLVMKMLNYRKNSGNLRHHRKVTCNEQECFQNECSIAIIARVFFEIANYLNALSTIEKAFSKPWSSINMEFLHVLHW